MSRPTDQSLSLVVASALAQALVAVAAVTIRRTIGCDAGCTGGIGSPRDW